MVFSIALRYLPDLIKDYKNISASIQARGLELGRKKTTLKAKIEGVVSIAVPLILSSFDDVGVIADALDLRGFGKNKKRTWYVETPYGRLDKICLVLGGRAGRIDGRLTWPTASSSSRRCGTRFKGLQLPSKLQGTRLPQSRISKWR